MIDHDKHVGKLLDLLDELGITENTFVMYSTDNGPHMNSWPDAGMTPFRNEKNSNWEGAYRVPAMVRWPGKIKAGSVSNQIDDGDLVAVRYDNWKAVFAQQRAPGTMLVWGEPFVKTRIPWLFNLRTDPYERATITSNTYWDWYCDHVYLLVPLQSYVGQFLATFEEFPPRQKAASFTIDQVMEQLSQPAAGAG
jgi:arylsulfatase